MELLPIAWTFEGQGPHIKLQQSLFAILAAEEVHPVVQDERARCPPADTRVRCHLLPTVIFGVVFPKLTGRHKGVVVAVTAEHITVARVVKLCACHPRLTRKVFHFDPAIVVDIEAIPIVVNSPVAVSHPGVHMVSCDKLEWVMPYRPGQVRVLRATGRIHIVLPPVSEVARRPVAEPDEDAVIADDKSR